MKPLAPAVRAAALVALLLAPSGVFGQQPAPAGGAQAAPGGRGLAPLTPATEPRPRDDARHQSFLQTAQAGGIDLLFVGDSITDWWLMPAPARGRRVWDEYFAPLKAANFGIAGDTTQGVLWRMRNGELQGFQARVIVLMLGTNNINRNPNDEIAEGDRLIVEEFRKQQPQARVLILGVFPRGEQPATPMRASIKAINEKLVLLADHQHVHYLDIGQAFLAEDGSLPPEIMPDGLHPNERGYRVWAEQIIGKVNELMK